MALNNDPKTLMLVNKFRLEYEKQFNEKCSLEKMLLSNEYLTTLIMKALDTESDALQNVASQVLVLVSKIGSSSSSSLSKPKSEPKKKIDDDDDDDLYLNGLR